MPQLSLYFDDATLKLVEKAAQHSNTSISRWVRGKVLESLENEWPEGYFTLFGSIEDHSFEVPVDPIEPSTTPRETL